MALWLYVICIFLEGIAWPSNYTSNNSKLCHTCPYPTNPWAPPVASNRALIGWRMEATVPSFLGWCGQVLLKSHLPWIGMLTRWVICWLFNIPLSQCWWENASCSASVFGPLGEVRGDFPAGRTQGSLLAAIAAASNLMPKIWPADCIRRLMDQFG